MHSSLNFHQQLSMDTHHQGLLLPSPSIVPFQPRAVLSSLALSRDDIRYGLNLHKTSSGSFQQVVCLHYGKYVGSPASSLLSRSSIIIPSHSSFSGHFTISATTLSPDFALFASSFGMNIHRKSLRHRV